MKRTALLIGALVCAYLLNAQIELTPKEYTELKISGELPNSFTIKTPELKELDEFTSKVQDTGQEKGGGSDCGCYIEPDASYTQITSWPLGSANDDDGSFGPVALPFFYDLYGTIWPDLYININGNVSFGTAYSTYTPDGFPNASFSMVAPFWGDVDLGGPGNGTVKYKTTTTAIYINWEDVGYFNEHTDKLNTFQLILTDGTDPVIGVGNNAAFCYKDMQWTTGDASQGTNGFGGFPAVVGANKGDGIDFIQFGTFDQAGSAYDGPFGNNDGIDWLDDKSFVLNTAVSGSNIAPIVSGLNICDTLTMCVGEVLDLDVTFLSPEQSQVTTGTSSAPTLSNYTEISNTAGINAVIIGQIIAMAADVGFHTVNFTGTDNGTPPLTAFIDVVIQVLPAPSAPPVISGDSIICSGGSTTLVTGGGFDNYEWSNGSSDTTITVGAGVYTVTGATGGCELVSDPFTIIESSPSPVIDGILFACGSDPTELSTINPYVSYNWSTGSTDPSILVTSGTYSVTVTDTNGCAATSAQVTVNISPEPIANFGMNPASPSLPGTIVTFTDLSTVSSGSIVSWDWDFGNGLFSSQQNPSVLYEDAGSYMVTLTVTTADGCTHTYIFEYVIQPAEIMIPNVFTPNNDELNQYFEIVGLEGWPGSSLTVYSRWGNVVFESSNYKNNWAARDVSEGTYYYVLALKGGATRSGVVNILR